MASDFHSMLQSTMLEQRRIMVSGALDTAAVSMLCAKLMALDGAAPGPVDVLMSSPGGPLDQVFALLDVIGLMRAPLNMTAIGSVTGTAAAVVACGSGDRQAAPHASFSLRLEPQRSTVSATADSIAQQADELASQRARYVDLLVAATRQDKAAIVEALDSGPRLSAEEAIAFGLIDSIVDRSAHKPSAPNPSASNPSASNPANGTLT